MKTAGVCRFSDDTAEILKKVINSDLVVYISPFIMGLYSALLKKYLVLLTKRWNIDLFGIIAKPGSEGVKLRPEYKNKTLFQKFELWGSSLVKIEN